MIFHLIHQLEAALTAPNEGDLWDAAVLEWSVDKAWECKCDPYFRGIQCEIPGTINANTSRCECCFHCVLGLPQSVLPSII